MRQLDFLPCNPHMNPNAGRAKGATPLCSQRGSVTRVWYSSVKVTCLLPHLLAAPPHLDLKFMDSWAHACLSAYCQHDAEGSPLSAGSSEETPSFTAGPEPQVQPSTHFVGPTGYRHRATPSSAVTQAHPF